MFRGALSSMPRDGAGALWARAMLSGPSVKQVGCMTVQVSGHPVIAPHMVKFYGIRNGIDQDIWDPQEDRFLPRCGVAGHLEEHAWPAVGHLNRHSLPQHIPGSCVEYPPSRMQVFDCGAHMELIFE